MGRMTVNESLADISSKCGYSEQVVRAVLNAEKLSVLERLKKGESATLMGRCTLTPSVKKKLAVGGGITGEIRVHATAIQLENSLDGVTEFINDDEADNTIGLSIVNQIPGLL